MSNYVLQIDLGDGFAKADKALDSLLKKVGSLSSAEVDFSMDAQIDKSGILGEKIGEKISGGMNKKLSSINIFDGWGKAVAKGISDSAIKGLRDVSGKDLAKVQAMGDITQFDKKTEKIDWKKVLTGLGLGLSNPYIGSRVLSDELGKKLSAGAGGGIAGGLFGKGGIAGFSEIFIAFKLFKFSVETFKQTIENARLDYAKALQSGLGLKFSIQRSNIAKIIGVSEQDVFRFGAQMAYLNPKLEDAVKILTETNKPLTQLSWDFKVLELDLKAMSAKLLVDLAPAIRLVVTSLDEFFKSISNYKTPDAFDGNKLGLKIHDYFFGNNRDKNKSGGIPDPQGWMKQLPTSSWEKLGLVTMGGGGNYAKETARNTKETAAMLKVLVQRAGVSKNAPGSWGMNPNTAQP